MRSLRLRSLRLRSLRLRSVLIAAGVSALTGIAAPAATACVYTPGNSRGASYYWTDSNGNDPDVSEGNCNIFDMSRGNLGPSYVNWRGWLKHGSGGYTTNGWHYDGTSGVGVVLASGVLYTTLEHAQVQTNSWRNQEYH